VDETQNLSVAAARGPSRAVITLNRDFLAILASEEAAGIGRSVAEIPRGDGWQEAKASAVLAGAIIGWLSPEAVRTFAFSANGNGPLEVVAKVGRFFITGHGIESFDDLTDHCSQRYGADPGESHLDEFTMTEPNERFAMGGALARRATGRMAVLLGLELDREAVLVVLGA